ncbi:MAG: hypothetical protein AB7G06_04825 [Bdellovibrionales bacterium]
MDYFGIYLPALLFWHNNLRHFQDLNAVICAQGFKWFDEELPMPAQAQLKTHQFLFDVYLEDPELVPDYTKFAAAADLLEIFLLDGELDPKHLADVIREVRPEVEKGTALLARAKQYFKIDEADDLVGAPLAALASNHASNMLSVLASSIDENGKSTADPEDVQALRDRIFGGRPQPDRSQDNPEPQL